jgi:hypothetical protein
MDVCGRFNSNSFFDPFVDAIVSRSTQKGLGVVHLGFLKRYKNWSV